MLYQPQREGVGQDAIADHDLFKILIKISDNKKLFRNKQRYK
jgi:hypothetical protein